MQIYVKYIGMPLLAEVAALAEASSDLMHRTAELPERAGVLCLSGEYRSAVYTLLAITGGL